MLISHGCVACFRCVHSSNTQHRHRSVSAAVQGHVLEESSSHIQKQNRDSIAADSAAVLHPDGADSDQDVPSQHNLTSPAPQYQRLQNQLPPSYNRSERFGNSQQAEQVLHGSV